MKLKLIQVTKSRNKIIPSELENKIKEFEDKIQMKFEIKDDKIFINEINKDKIFMPIIDQIYNKNKSREIENTIERYHIISSNKLLIMNNTNHLENANHEFVDN